MIKNRIGKAAAFATVGLALGLSACSGLDTLPTAELGKEVDIGNTVYRISSDDSLQIFVWRNPELSQSTVVRPDGKITVPLIEDMPVVGKTPTELARELEKKLSTYVQDPIVTVMMNGFVGLYEDRIRILGEAARPHGCPIG